MPAHKLGGSLSGLSAEQRGLYDEQGYLVVRGFFEPYELEVWKQRLLEVLEERVPSPRSMLVMRDVMVAKGVVAAPSRAAATAKLQDLQDDPVFFEGYCKHPKLLDWVEAFVGPDVKAIHTMLINKPPGVDGRHPLHQDLLYFPFRPADDIVATWTALDPCHRENGCLAVVPGSHKGGLRKHENPGWEHVNFLYVGAEGAGPETDRVHLDMRAGDVVFFHPLLLHGSGRNRSAGFRRAISCHYASARCRYVEGGAPLPGGGRPYVLVRGREPEGGI